MNVHFYIDNEEETPITDMYNVPIEPFKVGDRIKLSVPDLLPNDLEVYNGNMHLMIKAQKENKKLKEQFNFNDVEIKKIGRYARFNNINEATITIEYHCTLIVIFGKKEK